MRAALRFAALPAALRAALRFAALPAAVLLSASATPPAIPSSVWPLPANISLGSAALPIAAGFSLACASGALCPAPLPAALARYGALLFIGGAPAYGGGGTALPSLLVTVRGDAELSPSVDESYSLRVPADGSPATLAAATQWGALRGLESFLQLVVWAGPDAAPGAYAVTAAPAAVDDAPRFTHRGVLIDTSFNFLTVARVKEVIESMPVTKSNVLHWHILDDPAWPMESLTYPAFTAPGSGGPYARAATYSAAAQADIKAFAWERGVMILLEYDVPGHCASWAAGLPALVSACAGGHQTLINPVGEPGAHDGSFYEVLEGLMREFGERIGSPGLGLVHLGGDEVTDYTCWLQSAEVQAWATALGIDGSDAAQLRRAFTQRVQAVAAAVGLRAAFWEESFNGGYGVNTSAIVTPWVNPGTAARATAAGHDVINYVGFYLDQWVPPSQTSPDWYTPPNVSYGFIDSWRYMYTYPIEGGIAPGGGRVLGGVACAWGDQVDSSLGAAAMLFPRALAIGELLWSQAEQTRVAGGAQDPALDAVVARMEHARCRLAQRGVGAGPMDVAGKFGFCWSPAWDENGAGGGASAGSGGGGGLSDNAVAALAVGAAFVGAGVVAAWRWGATDDAGGATTPAADADAPRKGAAAAASSSAPRMVALDQFRGVTMIAMLFVNLYYGRTGLWAIFSHGITHVSGPDLVEPAFHFCVGYSLRLVVLKRLGAAAADATQWAPRAALFMRLLSTRVVGLIVLSMFFSEGWGQFDSWADIEAMGFGGWLLALVRNVQPYHTLLHIALLTVWTFVSMTMGPRVRVAQLAFTAALHILLLSTFYFAWIKEYGLDEGGYFGFLGWSITALVGSLAHDVVTSEAAAGGADAPRDGLKRPLLTVNSDAPASDEGEAEPRAPPAPRGGRVLRLLVPAAVALMVLAYLLSCLGAVAALNPVCYDGTRIFFWGGFGDEKDCSLLPVRWGWAVAPPFVTPDPAANVVTQWTMTQRAGSATYHIFTAGTSLLIFAGFFAACEVGVAAPPAALAPLARAVGLVDGGRGRWLLRSHFADVFGENSLAVYLLSDPLGNNVGNMLPADCPAWYFLVFGEGLYFVVAYAATAYLRHHKLFLRL
jgi:hexosaminidase